MTPFISVFILLVHIACIKGQKDDNRPNIILIMTDDQDIILDSMQAMPNTIELIANSKENGIAFDNAYIATPICCPSRTESISGRHYQNIMNQDTEYHSCMHVSAVYNTLNSTTSMFQIFNANGYLTGSFGKLINDQDQIWCPSTDKNGGPVRTNGFSRINGPCSFGYYQKTWFDMYMNGTSILHNISNPIIDNYFTSIIGNQSLEWFDQVLSLKTRKPFLAWIGPHAPHCPSIPSGWYWDRFNDSIAPRTPNWNILNKNHHSFVSSNPSLNDTNSGDAVTYIDQLYRDRLRTLLSVDDIVYEIFNLLTTKYPSELNNTYIVVTSDHGFDLGQLRIPCSKQEPYETAIKIPMYIYGPNVSKTIVNKSIVSNVDLLPTFLDISGIKYNENDYDGQSWMKGNKFKRDVFISQYESVGTYGFSHCGTWFPGNQTNSKAIVPGNSTKPPETNAINQTWFVDDEYSNNWRALRIINESMNVMYVEFYNYTKNGWPNNTVFETPYFHEFYNMSIDPWQIDNIYSEMDKQTKNVYHSMLMTYGSCKGTDCW